MENFADYIRNHLIVEHPAFDDNTVLITGPINDLFSSVRRILLMRETGCCFTAQSGAGKTRALMRLEQLLLQRMPNLVVLRHNSWNQQVPSIRAFFKHFLSTAAHRETRGETYDLRERLVRRVHDMARANNSPVAVFLIDEANAMVLEDFLFLKDVHNDLDKEGIQLITIMMGQEPEFDIVIDNLRSLGRLDLIGRFARRKLCFRPISSREDLLGIFPQYDSTVHPSGSTQSWTRYFMPHAWEAGFRLGDEVDPFIEAVQKSLGRKKVPGYPARQTFLAIRAYLLDQASRDTRGRRPEPEQWTDAIAYALLPQAVADMKTERTRSGRVKV